jgi:ABC-type nitrate/sulfonate/bicarbonate transport system substrate-binding protein
MLLRAVAEVQKGKRVFVVAANSRHFGHMRALLADNGVKLARNFPVRLVSAESLESLLGLASERCAVFVDHHVWEVASSSARSSLYGIKWGRPGLFHE